MPRRDDGEVRNSLTANATTVVQAGHLHGGVHFHHHQPTPLRTVQLELAAAVHSQWRDEALRRGLLDNHPLRVPWAAAHWSLADHGDDIAGGFSGDHSAPSRLAASFRTLSRRRLVVLGEGGSGKTALTLLLILGLLNDLRADEPVPVPMSIASWDPHQEHLLAWLARRLQEDYPGIRRYGRAVAEQLLTERRIMPVLDGLDEAPLRWQGSALTALNQSLTIDDPLVLTCRTDNYAQAVQYGDVLRTAAVVQAQPVPRQAVIDHLHRATPPHRTAQWAPVFEQLADRAETPVAQALTSPLIISLARTVYTRSHAAPAELLDRSRFPNREAIENYLLNALIPAVYQNSPAPPAPGRRRQPGARYELHKATRWAVFLAQHTYRLGTRDIAWWDIKYTTPSIVYALAAWLTSAVFLVCPWILLAVHVPSPTDIYAQYAVLFSLLSLVIGIRAAYRARKPKPPIQTMLASSAKPFEVIKYGLRLILFSFFFLVLTLVLLPGAFAAFGLAALFWGPRLFGILRMFWGIASQNLHVHIDPVGTSSPSRTLRSDRTANLLMLPSFAMAAFLPLSPVLAFKLTTTDAFTALPAGVIPASIGILFGTVFVLDSAWWHFVVARSWLAFRGRLPARLMHYLTDAQERELLRQAGAVHQFRHARLHDNLLFYR
ncbi:hypothetical protein INP57_24005 [Saccharopolyspora sp. HNM0986]|uniref:hypothetical protein n=1 Tax=Saccharopolyspora galaxeae TaxID=2781241 RepID=UPI00190B1361|nr:hypothetical protein [Saccharopolyspora sp. HNM0986]MBK0869883.1 hypothetical protein [Saccharopolyspora sp. HNM0986]